MSQEDAYVFAFLCDLQAVARIFFTCECKVPWIYIPLMLWSLAIKAALEVANSHHMPV